MRILSRWPPHRLVCCRSSEMPDLWLREYPARKPGLPARTIFFLKLIHRLAQNAQDPLNSTGQIINFFLLAKMPQYFPTQQELTHTQLHAPPSTHPTKATDAHPSPYNRHFKKNNNRRTLHSMYIPPNASKIIK